MTLPAVDMAPSSTAPLPDGAIAPTSDDGASEAGTTPDVPAPQAPAGEAMPAKSPAASLISIAGKTKSSGPTKAGDLTRFFELARRQPATATQSEPLPTEPTPAPTVEIESTQSPVAAVPTPIETPVDETPLAEAPMVETAVASTPLEPNFPLMLAPPQAVTDTHAPVLVHVAEGPALTVEPDAIAVPDWVKAMSTVEDTLPSETAEPLKVGLFPAEETISDAEHESAETAPPSAPAAVIEAPLSLAEPPPPPRELAPVIVAPATPAATPIPAAPPTPVFKELVDYWRSLRHGDDNPGPESIDRDLVTERWPGSLLMAYAPASQDTRGELRPSRVTRLGTACAETQSVAEVGSQSTEWMLEVARTALVNDEPVEEFQRLETLTGVAGFRMVALPLGPPRGLPNAVLCILTPNPGAPRFGKRRLWL